MPDPLLQRLSPDDLPPDMKGPWEASMELRGDATLFEVMAHHPALFRWYTTKFYGALFHAGEVPRRYKEILRLRLSTRHGCRFCNQGNRPDALAAGLNEAEVDAVQAGGGSALTDADSAVVSLADRLAIDDPGGTLDPDLVQKLKEHFSEGPDS